MANIIGAFKAFWSVLTGTELVPAKGLVPKREVDALRSQLEAAKADAAAKAEAAAKAASRPDRFREGAIYTLLLLQREGRLVDFLQENLDAYADEQIGAAVRRIHQDSAKVLRDSFGLAAVIDRPEGERVEAPVPHDPSAVKLTGNVPDAAPYRGILRHRGWRAARVHLPERTGELDITVVQPAEIEI